MHANVKQPKAKGQFGQRRQGHSSDGHPNTPLKNPSLEENITERCHQISQSATEVFNTGHSPRHDGAGRATSQLSKTALMGGNHEKIERLRRHDRHSLATSGDIEAPVLYENTRRMEPDAVFRPDQVKTIIKDVLYQNLEGQKYDKDLMTNRCLALSDIIKEKVKQLNLERFKIVTMVLIGQKKEQSLLISSRCLWNPNYDNFASCEYSNGNLFAVGMVFGCVQE